MTTIPLVITDDQRDSMRDFIRAKIQAIPCKISTLNISEHAQANRIMPRGTPRPGPWDNDYTPYLVEPMDNMGPRSPIQRTVVMKAAQLGFTAMGENVICYYIGEMPADTLLISATEGTIERWAVRRLEPAIDSYGLRSTIYAQTEVKGSKRTGDKMFSKEYQGCMLDMASAQAAALLRATDKRVLVRDEIDGAPPNLRTGEGNWLDVSYVRTNAWGDRRKVLDISTPKTFTDSLIWLAYQEGDQRKFLVACPYCKRHQELVMGTDKSEHGLKGSFKAGTLEEVYYLCENCHDALWDHHKTELLISGRWEPTAKPSAPSIRSYQLPSLYSPAGMLTWEEIYRHYLKAQESPDGMRSFVNLYLGKPFKEAGSRPKLEKVIELRGGYNVGTVPDGVLFLTAGIDVQRGSARDSKHPARLEMEICGHGAGFRTWSVLYKVIEGEIDDPSSGAWQKLAEYARETEFKFYRKDGRAFPVTMILIDSGDGMFTDTVYRFTAGWQSTFPSKGFGKNFKLDKKRREKDGDSLSYSNFKKYRAVKIGEDIILYEIATNYYKTHLYNNLKIKRQDIGQQKPGFCEFPINYSEEYFRQLTAEERRPSDGSFHLSAGRRNEALDCRVMNLCAADVFLNEELMNAKARAQANGASRDQVQTINTKTVLTYLERLVMPQIDKR
jgi:phage terminase large subunit GpA-like protein